MKKQEKLAFVQNLTEELKSASSVILVDYTGLSVKMQQNLKKRLREIDANLIVVKNTLFKLAAEKAIVPSESTTDTVLSGPTALVITKADPITPLQVLSKFAKENDIPHLKIGIIEGAFQDKESLEKLSKFSGKNALFAQAIGTISQPINLIVFTLQAKLQDLISVLDQASKK